MPSLSVYKTELDYSYAPGIFPGMECLKYRPEQARRLLIHSSARGRDGVDRLISLAESLHLRVEEADRALSRISGKENCYAAVVFAKFSDRLNPMCPHVLLHQPGDSGNVGTILRTALGFGIEDVALVRPCVDLYDPRTVRASMGSLFRLRLKVYESFEAYAEEQGKRDYYPFMLDASVPLEAVTEKGTEKKSTLIFGNEGRGLPPEFAKLGQPVRIPSNEKIDSLNLAIAAGIGIYCFTRSFNETEVPET